MEVRNKVLSVILFALCMAVAVMPTYGHNYKVESFEIVPTDLSARTNKKVDANGQPCAILKIYVPDKITAVDGPVIDGVVDRGMEKWVYVAHDGRRVKLLFANHYPLDIVFDDFNYPSVTSQMVYVVKLAEEGAELALQYTVSASQSEEKILAEALAAVKNGAYDMALNLYRQIDSKASAQFNIGVMYRRGEGVLQDDAEAVRWYRKSAEQGYANAQCNLGFMYENGYGVEKDKAEAVRWYRKAAEQGHKTAIDNLKRLGEY